MSTGNCGAVVYSIGHSNHPLDRFLDLLKSHGIQAIADVRSSPYSRYCPHFSQDELAAALKDREISYVYLGAELGARRAEPSCYRNGKVDYAEVIKTEAFQRGIDRLVAGALRMKVAMLCAEQDPLECHRTILIGRHLLSWVGDVLHILPDGGLESQAQAVQRLLVECDLQHAALFATREERIEEAYQRRGGEIAYEEQESNA